MFDFEPVNRHVWVDVLKEEKPQDTAQILLPEDYAPPQSKYAICNVITSASDCTLSAAAGDLIIVENSMINELSYKNQTFSIILENYVYGVLRN
jgi:co-chaperonin GroES (HSP10)